MTKLRVNTFLVFSARRRATGGNVHQLTALIRGYEMAVEVATDPRCRDRYNARQRIAAAEEELARFCYGGAQHDSAAAGGGKSG